MTDSTDDAGPLESPFDADSLPRTPLESSSLNSITAQLLHHLSFISLSPSASPSGSSSGSRSLHESKSFCAADGISPGGWPFTVTAYSSAADPSSANNITSSDANNAAMSQSKSHDESNSHDDSNPHDESNSHDEAGAPILPRLELSDDLTIDLGGPEHLWGLPEVQVQPSISSAGGSSAEESPARKKGRKSRRRVRHWNTIPHEIRLQILTFLKPKDLVRASRASRSFHALCFDGQLWHSLDAAEFYREIPAASLLKLVVNTGPFLRHLDLRGCVQLDQYRRVGLISKCCQRLVSITLEGCRRFDKLSLLNLMRLNRNLVHLNLSGLFTLTDETCAIIATSCPLLESIDVSWCSRIEAKSLKPILEHCTRLKDLRARGIRGFNCVQTAQTIFLSHTLERLILSECTDLNDESLGVMLRGESPEFDSFTDSYTAPPSNLRHLDLSRCRRLTNVGIQGIGYMAPKLQGLQLSKCRSLTNAGLEHILESCPDLTHLELDEIEELTDSLFSDYLAKAPCARKLKHLSLSFCEAVGDEGLLPVIRSCVSLRSLQLDNTKVSDAVLAEAAAMVQKRSAPSTDTLRRPKVTLRMVVFDCPRVTWLGIREVMRRNAEIRRVEGDPGKKLYPTEIISLKCFYGFQMTVDMHMSRLLRGELLSATKLVQKWTEFMRQSDAEFAEGRAARRRRRLHARQADESVVWLLEEGSNPPWPTLTNFSTSCAIM